MAWRWQRQGVKFWRELPLGASLLFFGSVFCLFASFSFIQPQPSTAAAWIGGGISGGTAVSFAFLGTRGHYRWLIAAAIAVGVGSFAFDRVSRNPVATHVSEHNMAAAAIFIIVAGYMLMLWFIGTEGRRFGRLRAEVDLASQIHRALSPPLAGRIGDFEYAGVSQPSGMVGGDLLDVMAGDAGWIIYVADVSGHGVAAGVLTGLVKSGARTWLAARPAGAGMLAGLNRVLTGMLPPESFVTFGGLSASASSSELRLACAGHLPLLHFHAASDEVTRAEVDNFPLGLFADGDFNTVPIECEPGDLLALYTDGLTEIFTARGGESGPEFGLDGLTAALRVAARQPLQQAVEAVLGAARAFGPQSDDQTLLLLRRLAVS